MPRVKPSSRLGMAREFLGCVSESGTRASGSYPLFSELSILKIFFTDPMRSQLASCLALWLRIWFLEKPIRLFGNLAMPTISGK